MKEVKMGWGIINPPKDEKNLKLSLTDQSCFCDSKDFKVKMTVGGLDVIVCEECLMPFYSGVRNLLEKVGQVFPIVVFSSLMNMRKEKYGSVKPIKDWTSEEYEDIRNLCCETVKDFKDFDRVIHPAFIKGKE